MHDHVLRYIRERKLLKAGDRVAVAVSGGADSVALLRVLFELRAGLGIVLHVAHYNHQLRDKESDDDEQFVAELAGQFDLPYFAGRADVRAHATANKLSLEHAARELRYQWLTNLAREENLDAIATAHNSDDQAETVLMKFLRGAGTRGLAGIHPVVVMDGVAIVRPLLETPRATIEGYLGELNQPWREDHTNRDAQYTRNRLRHELLPLLERDYNPGLRGILSASADVAAEEECDWERRTAACLQACLLDDDSLALIRVRRHVAVGLATESVALQRRVLKSFLERHGIAGEFQNIEAVRRCIHPKSPAVNLPGGWTARYDRLALVLVPPVSPEHASDHRSFRWRLECPGRVRLPEASLTLQADVLSPQVAVLQPPGSLLQMAKIGGALTLRNWLPGDRFRPAHSGSEEKLKRLFAEKHIPAEQRPLWPVALFEGRIVWVRGFPVAHDFAWTPGSGDAVRIEVLPLNPESGAT